MKLIIGLGNIGEKYQNTRHNSGFSFVDAIAESSWREDKKMEAMMVKQGELILIKPTTFMNESGRAVRKIIDFYKISTDDIVLVHDDLDIRLGDYKIQVGVGPKVHNGVSSVEECVGTVKFLRVRLGVDSRQNGIDYGSGSDYVLSRLQAEELKTLDKTIEKAKLELMNIIGVKQNG